MWSSEFTGLRLALYSKRHRCRLVFRKGNTLHTEVRQWKKFDLDDLVFLRFYSRSTRPKSKHHQQTWRKLYLQCQLFGKRLLL